MLAILARYVYPEVVKLAEARQRAVTRQLEEAQALRVKIAERLSAVTSREE